MADDNAHLKSGTGTHIFRLKGLRTKVFLQENPNYAPYDIAPVNASYFMDISINSLLLDDLIFISSASNYIDNSKWPDISFSMGQIKNSNKTDIDTYFVDKITKNIGPAWLAKNITGGYNNSDIFHNEDELVKQYITMDKTLNNFSYLQISPTNLNKKLAINNVTITDITTNTPLKLYSPDSSGADFVTPGWEAGYEPSYALTGSDSEYLLYNTLDPSGVFIKYGFNTQIGHAYRINVDCCNNDTLSDYNSEINVSIIDSDNNKQLYLHYDDLTEVNTILDSSAILQLHNGGNISDASTNIILYDNTIKSQLIKLLKRGGTSEANPTSGSNLQRYYVGKHNLGREIMLSMFAADNEATIDRINNILTSIPPPITYNVTLGNGTQGDNSGNTVFFLNGVETPVLNLTRGLDYEFNINGTDISKNKFIFTKQYDDGVDICLNPLDTTKVITSGLTYEIGFTLDTTNYYSPVSFEEFYEDYAISSAGVPFNHYIYDADNNRYLSFYYTNADNTFKLKANYSYDIYIIGGGGGGGSASGLGTGGGGGGMIKLNSITPTSDKIIQIKAGSGGEPDVAGTESYVIMDDNTYKAYGGAAGFSGHSSSTGGAGGGTQIDEPANVDTFSSGGDGGRAKSSQRGDNGSDGPNGGPGGGGGGAGDSGWANNPEHRYPANGGNGNSLYFTGGGGGGGAYAAGAHGGEQQGSGGSGYYSGGAGGYFGTDGTENLAEDGGGLPGTFGERGYNESLIYNPNNGTGLQSFGGGGGAFGGGGGGAGGGGGGGAAAGGGGIGAIIISSPDTFISRPSGPTTKRKIKWSVPFNEINVPTNSFYSSDISDNLGSNIIFNANPIYGAMKFIDGDSIQFHLDYSQKSIVDSSGVALDSSGNKLGSNSVEDQDYIVRLKIHDLFHYPKFVSRTPPIANLVNNIAKTIDVEEIALNDNRPAGLTYHTTVANDTELFIGNVTGKNFTVSIKYNNLANNRPYQLMIGNWPSLSGERDNTYTTDTHGDDAVSGQTGRMFLGFNQNNLRIGFPGIGLDFVDDSYTPARTGLGNGTASIVPRGTVAFNSANSQIYTIMFNYNTKLLRIYLDGQEEEGATAYLKTSDYNNVVTDKDNAVQFDDLYLTCYNDYTSRYTMDSCYLIHDIIDPNDIQYIHSELENYSVDPTNQPISIPGLGIYSHTLDSSKNYEFNHTSTENNRNWYNWVTLDGSGIYLNNEASGNILGLQFATDSDEFGIGISTDICNNIWEEKQWDINETPTDVSMISSNKFIWAFDASLNGNDYKYKIADTGGVIEDYPVDKLHNQKYNWKIEIKSDGKLCLKTSTDSALNVISSYSNIILDPDTRYYLWIGSKDASFNFTNLKYLPERKVFDDKVTLGPLTPTSTPGSTIPYNSYNVTNQSDSTTYITVADEILLVTVANSKFYINGNTYNDANPLELDKNKTYRFNLVNATNVDTLLGFSTDSGNATPYNNVTYNGTPGVYSLSSTVPKHLRTPYVDINISGEDPSILYYYDVSGVATNTAGKINFT